MKLISRILTQAKAGKLSKSQLDRLSKLYQEGKIPDADIKLYNKYRSAGNAKSVEAIKRAARSGKAIWAKKKDVMPLIEKVDKKLKAKKALTKTDIGVIKKMKLHGLLGKERAKYIRDNYDSSGKVKK